MVAGVLVCEHANPNVIEAVISSIFIQVFGYCFLHHQGGVVNISTYTQSETSAGMWNISECDMLEKRSIMYGKKRFCKRP